LNPQLDGDGKLIVVYFGHGGPRAAGVYTRWDQVEVGARYFFEKISGGTCKSFKNENDAWKEFSNTRMLTASRNFTSFGVSSPTLQQTWINCTPLIVAKSTTGTAHQPFCRVSNVPTRSF
jgi:hypothetical protein